MVVRSQGYQPTWSDGKEHGIGWRDANGRYEAIKRYLVGRMARTDLRQYQEPSVLDIGAYNGYFCRRLADDFKARVLAIDGQPFLEEYHSPSGGYVDVMHAVWSPEDIRAQEGNADIILCLSVLHHWPNWSDYLDAMSQTGSTLFIELANPWENISSDARALARAALSDLRSTHYSTLIAQTPPMNNQPTLRPMFAVETRKAFISA